MLITLITAPFLIWLSYVSYNHIQSPFESGLNHSHMGSYSLLFDFKFLRKFISWNLFKGIGFILTVFFGLFLWNIRKRNLTEFEYFLLIWAAGVFPYWLLVRWGNQMHDYYSMQFMFPFSCLAVHEICRLGLHDFKKVWIYVLLTLQLVLAVNESLRLRPIEHSQFAEAPFLE